MVALSYGTLPALSFLAIHAKLTQADACAALETMRRSLHTFGVNNTLREMLRAHGFEMRDVAFGPVTDAVDPMDHNNATVLAGLIRQRDEMMDEVARRMGRDPRRQRIVRELRAREESEGGES